jgi:hypothetical protein
MRVICPDACVRGQSFSVLLFVYILEMGDCVLLDIGIIKKMIVAKSCLGIHSIDMLLLLLSDTLTLFPSKRDWNSYFDRLLPYEQLFVACLLGLMT